MTDKDAAPLRSKFNCPPGLTAKGKRVARLPSGQCRLEVVVAVPHNLLGNKKDRLKHIGWTQADKNLKPGPLG